MPGPSVVQRPTVCVLSPAGTSLLTERPRVMRMRMSVAESVDPTSSVMRAFSSSGAPSTLGFDPLVPRAVHDDAVQEEVRLWLASRRSRPSSPVAVSYLVMTLADGRAITFKTYTTLSNRE